MGFEIHECTGTLSGTYIDIAGIASGVSWYIYIYIYISLHSEKTLAVNGYGKWILYCIAMMVENQLDLLDCYIRASIQETL